MFRTLQSLTISHFESISWDDYKTGRLLCIMVIKGHEILGGIKLLEKKICDFSSS